MAFVLTPQPPVAEWLSDFDEFAKRSPGFFIGRPVVVDIQHMPATRSDLIHLVTELRRRNITIMGLDGRSPGELGADARGLPPILSGGKEIGQLAKGADLAVVEPAVAGAEDDPATAAIDEAVLAAVEKAIEETPPETLIVDHPLRSGQSIYHTDGDVVVVGTAASGSEIVAGGSIHVYGALRGRAIAGSSGKRGARIFAQALDAELIAIDGLYKTAEDLGSTFRGKAVHAWLEGDALKLAAF